MITPFLLYLGRASLYMAVFYAFFLLVMRKTSFFRLNRAALLIGTVACHVLPLIRLRTVFVTKEIGGEALTAVGEPVLTGVGSQPAAFLLPTLLYLAGVGVVVALVAVSVLRTARLVRKGSQVPCNGYRLTLVDGDIPSFSCLRHIVMSRSDYEKYPAILRHEIQHIRHCHSLDILLITAVNAVHWFNPLVWIARTELALLHEYEADESLIQDGIDATSYQLLLVRKAVGEHRFSMANGFNHAKLKQRIAMMQKKHSPSFIRYAYVGVLPILALTMFACNPANEKIKDPAQEEQKDLVNIIDVEKGTQTVVPLEEAPAPVQEAVAEHIKREVIKDAVPFNLVDVKPKFQGGDANTFAKWVSEHLTYPEEAKEACVSGRVLLQYVVNTDGSVSDVKVLRGVHPALDAEAVRVVSSSPDWTPGQQKDQPVKVTYQFPVIFQLK